LDEELHAFTEAGAEVYALSDRADRETKVGKVQMLALSPSSMEEIRRTLAFVLRRRRDLTGAHSASRELFWPARVERFAADLIRRHGIDVIHSHFGWPSGFGGLLASADTSTPLVAMFGGWTF
jgi:NAD(P)-dependent dehydrogenase (short-subunit alcohol dehydrogenase family)